MAFPKAKKSVVWAEFSIGLQNSIFVLGKHTFPNFIEKFLKYREMDYPIHYVKFKMWPALVIPYLIFNSETLIRS